ncbi:MAG: L-rhamnose mutarotase [Acidobacteriota bacterium]
MQRVCFVLQVKPDRLDEYRERHRDVWPEMQEALSKSGWNNYSLFLRDDGMLVGYLETEDFERARKMMSETSINAVWQAPMKDFFVDEAGRTADKQMRPLEQVFYLP